MDAVTPSLSCYVYVLEIFIVGFNHLPNNLKYHTEKMCCKFERKLKFVVLNIFLFQCLMSD